MKFLNIFPILIFICLSDQSFIFEPKNAQAVNAANRNRFIVNIVEYSYVNGTKTTGKFRCLGSLISDKFVLTTASCVHTNEGTYIGIQFETIRDDTNEVGYSITFDETTVWAHDNYNPKDNETNNIALIKYDPMSITTNPPLFSIFKSRAFGNIPKVADVCYIIGRNVHLSSPPQDNVFVIGPESCYGKGGNQAYCTIIEDPDQNVCKVLQGAPLICKDNEIAGIVLGGPKMCIQSGSRYQIRYHSVGDFSKFLKYYSEGPTTTPKPKKNSATIYKFSLSSSVIIFIWLFINF